jgi:hypothetical protein
MTKKYVSLEHAIRNAVRDQQYTKKPLNEDFEFEMARNELRTAIDAAKRLMAHLDGEGELEAWVQSKITKGADYLDTVADYMDSRDTKKLKEETEEIMEALGIVGGVFNGNQFTGGTPHIAPGSTKAAIGVSNDRRSAKETKSLTMHGKITEAGLGRYWKGLGTGSKMAHASGGTIAGSAVLAPKATENAFDKGLGAAQEWGKENLAPIRNKIDSGLSKIADPVAEVIPDAVKSTLSAGTKKVRDFFNTDKNMPSSDEIGKNLAQKKDNFSKLTPAQQKMVPSSVKRSLSNATPENTEARLKGAATVADLASYVNPVIGATRMGSDAYGHAEKGQYTASALDAIPAVKGTFKSAIPTMVKGVVDPQSPDKDEDNSKPNVTVDDIFNPNKSETKPNSIPTSSNKPSSSDIFGAPVGVVSKDDKTEKESGPTKNKKSLKETILAVRNAALNEYDIPYKPKIPAPKPKIPAPEVKPEPLPKPKPEVVPEQPQPPQPGEDPALPKQVPTKKPGKKPKQEPVEEPAETPAEEPSKEPAKEPAKEPSKQPAETPGEKTAPKPAEEPGPGPKPAEEPKHEPSSEKTPEKPRETKTENKPRLPIPFPFFVSSSSQPNYNWKGGHSNPWVIHRAQSRIRTEEVDRKDIEVVARKDEKKDRQNVGRFGKSQLTKQSAILQNRVDEEKKMAGVIKSIVKKKKEEKEGGPNPLVDFEPNLNHKYDNES